MRGIARATDHPVNTLQVKSVVRGTVERWIEVEGYRLAASLAFYALMSFIPLVVLGLAALEIVLGNDTTARWEVLAWVDATGSTALKSTVASALLGLRDPSNGVVGLVVGLVGALIGASGVFGELDTDLNRIFGSEKPTKSFLHAVRTFLHDRLWAFAAVLVTSLIVLVATILGTATVAVGEEIAPPWTTQVISFGATTLLLGGALALCFRWVPATAVRWKSAAIGGLAAAVAVQLVRIPFGWAIVRFTHYPTYGVMGSVLVVLMWMWVAACILLLGASATATLDGRPIAKLTLTPIASRIRPRLAKTEIPAPQEQPQSQTLHEPQTQP